MIVDKFENSGMYFSVNGGFKKGFEFIEKFLQNELPDGRYDVDGDTVYALVQSYETVPEQEMKWEAHRKYIDIQFVVKGKEIIGWTSINELVNSTEYDEVKDFILFKDGEGTQVKLKDSWFAIFFPEDLHKPKCLWGSSQNVKKIVVKVKV